MSASGAVSLLADELAKLNSMLTVNTSPIAQAVIVGKLLGHDGSLVRANEREATRYRENLRCLPAALTTHFPPGSPVTWSTSNGGFFRVVTVPFETDDALLEASAQDHGVLWTPMRHFHDAPEARRQLRLSVGVLTPDLVEEGAHRLARLITDPAHLTAARHTGPPRLPARVRDHDGWPRGVRGRRSCRRR